MSLKGINASIERSLCGLCLRSRIFTAKKWQYFCWSSAICYSLITLLSLSLGGFLPLPPSLGAKVVHAHYFSHPVGVQIGAILLLIGGVFYIPYLALISKQMRLISNVDPILCDLQLVAGVAGTFTTTMPAIFLALVVFRDYGENNTLMLSDLFWLSTNLQWPTFLMQSWSLAWAVFADNSRKPVFPKIMGVVNFIAPLLVVMRTGVHMYHTGPLAWNGWLVFTCTLLSFGLPFSFNIVCLFLNIRAVQEEQSVTVEVLPTTQPK